MADDSLVDDKLLWHHCSGLDPVQEHLDPGEDPGELPGSVGVHVLGTRSNMKGQHQRMNRKKDFPIHLRRLKSFTIHVFLYPLYLTNIFFEDICQFN